MGREQMSKQEPRGETNFNDESHNFYIYFTVRDGLQSKFNLGFFSNVEF